MSGENEVRLGRFGQAGKFQPQDFKAGVKKDDFEDKQKLIFEKFDNGNGVMENAELDKMQEQISVFAKDGKITRKEARKFLKQNGLRGKEGRAFAKEHGMKGQVKVKDAFKMMKNYEAASDKIDTVKEFQTSLSVKYKPDAEGTVRTDLLAKSDGTKFADIVEKQDGEKITTEYNGEKIDRQTVEKDGVKETTTYDENGKVELKTKQKGSVTEFFDGNDKITARDTDLGGGNIKQEKFVYDDNGNQIQSITKDPIAKVETTSDFKDGKEVKRTEKFDDGKVVVGEFVDGTEVKRTETAADGKTVATTEFSSDKQTTTISFEGKNISQVVKKDGKEHRVDYDGNGNTLGVVVQNGESPAAIAKKYGVTKEALLEANKDLLKGKEGHKYFLVGQQIRIPGEVAADKFAEMNVGRKTSAEAVQAYRDAMAAKRAQAIDDNKSKVANMTPAQVRQATVDGLKDMLGNARADFKAQKDADGWAGKLADRISILWGSKNRESVVSQDLLNFENQLKSLAEAKDEKAFKQQFKIMYGMDYDDAKVREWLANPTGGNYKRAFGTENDMARRVAVYNKSQQIGAGVVKGVVATGVMIAGTAAAIPTGGASLVAAGSIAFGIGAATTAAVEISDRATNNIDNSQDIYSKQAVKDIAVETAIAGTINAVTFGMGASANTTRVAAKTAQSTTTGTRTALPAAENVAKSGAKAASQSGARTGAQASQSGARTGAQASQSGARTGAQSTTGQSGARTSARGQAASQTGAGAGAQAATEKATIDFVEKAAGKVATNNAGVASLTKAEQQQLADILNISVDELSQLSRKQIMKRLLKMFHPDHNSSAYANEITQKLNDFLGMI